MRVVDQASAQEARANGAMPPSATLNTLAHAMDAAPALRLSTKKRWPVIGAIDETGALRREAGDRQTTKTLDASIVAAIAQGTALRPVAADGDLLLIAAWSTQAVASLIGQLCLCRLDDGRAMIRVPQRSPKAHRLDLIPLDPFAPIDRQARLESAQPVLLALPPALFTADAIHQVGRAL